MKSIIQLAAGIEVLTGKYEFIEDLQFSMDRYELKMPATDQPLFLWEVEWMLANNWVQPQMEFPEGNNDNTRSEIVKQYDSKQPWAYSP